MYRVVSADQRFLRHERHWSWEQPKQSQSSWLHTGRSKAPLVEDNLLRAGCLHAKFELKLCTPDTGIIWIKRRSRVLHAGGPTAEIDSQFNQHIVEHELPKES